MISDTYNLPHFQRPRQHKLKLKLNQIRQQTSEWLNFSKPHHSIWLLVALALSNGLCQASSLGSATHPARLFKRAATARLDRLWDDAVIPYEIDSIFDRDRVALFRSAMRHWENFTCIKFVERNPEEHKNYIVFTERSCGCCSFVGKRGNGPQAISIGKHCDKFGIVVHELGHVVGFWHEHTRPDRDQHVQIIGKNIMPGQEYNFNKLTRDEVNSLGLAYDYDSILHYATNTFAKDSQLDTILPLHGYLNTEETTTTLPINIAITDSRLLNTTINNKSSGSNGSMINDQTSSMKLKLIRDIQSMILFGHSTTNNRSKREVDIDVQSDEHMLAIDGLLAKTRPEIGQRVRLSVGDIAQTNLLYRCPKCGRTIQQPSGIIHSPGYYLRQDKRSSLAGMDFCEWRLSAGLGERIMLNITDLDLASPSSANQADSSAGGRFGLPRSGLFDKELYSAITSHGASQNDDPMIMSHCDRDFLEVRDGYTYQAPVIARLCGHSSALKDVLHPVTSSSNRLLVIYKTSPNSINPKRGFIAQHEALCGGVIVLGDVFNNNLATRSGYRSQNQPIHNINLKVHQNGSSPSENEVLLNSQIVNRGNMFQSNQPTIFQASKVSSPETLSQRHSLQKDANNNSAPVDQLASRLEILQYSSQPLVTANSFASIQSPNWPDVYRPSRECLWQVKVGDNHKIALRFDAFDLEQHDSCAYDYVEVRDGELSDAKLIARFCGQRVPDQILSSSKNMLIKFVSDSDVNKGGFMASVQSELDYCTLGLHDCSHKCSSSNTRYRCECPEGLELAVDGRSCVPICGGIRNDTFGQITSPHFPDLYPINTKCVWQIRGPPHHHIILNFTYFDLEGLKSRECDYDFIDIKSKLGDNKFMKHGKFCGSSQAFAITSVSNELIFEFSSDNSVQRSGFIANFVIDEDECSRDNGGCQHTCSNNVGSYQCSCNPGFILHEDMHSCVEQRCLQSIIAPEGTINYTLLPTSQEGDHNCSWVITTMPGHRVKLVFEKLAIEDSKGCDASSLSIHDGLNEDDFLLGRYCGPNTPPVIVSSLNSIFLSLRARSLSEKIELSIVHSTVCGGRLQAVLKQNDLIYSHPRFDGVTQYNRNEDCEWLIESSSNQRIKAEFSFLSLESDGNCNYDHVTIYDGPDESSSYMARLCGSDMPKRQSEIISSSESMLIVFRSDDSINSRGFSLVYTAVESSEDESVAMPNLKGTKYAQSHLT